MLIKVVIRFEELIVEEKEVTFYADNVVCDVLF